MTRLSCGHQLRLSRPRRPLNSKGDRGGKPSKPWLNYQPSIGEGVLKVVDKHESQCVWAALCSSTKMMNAQLFTVTEGLRYGSRSESSGWISDSQKLLLFSLHRSRWSRACSDSLCLLHKAHSLVVDLIHFPKTFKYLILIIPIWIYSCLMFGSLKLLCTLFRILKHRF